MACQRCSAYRRATLFGRAAVLPECCPECLRDREHISKSSAEMHRRVRAQVDNLVAKYGPKRALREAAVLYVTGKDMEFWKLVNELIAHNHELS